MSQASPYSPPTSINPAGVIAGVSQVGPEVGLEAGELEFSPGFDLPRPGEPKPVQIVRRGVPRLPDPMIEDDIV